MANTISPNMGLVVPGVGTEISPTWATDINASLSSIDSHNHSSGQGVQIQPNGLNINADLPFQSNNATQLRSVRFTPQASPLALATDIGCVYVVNNELYYNDVTGGNQVQLTSNGNVVGSAGTITGLTSPATASYAAGVFSWKSSATNGAGMLMGSPILTNSGNLTNQLTVQAPVLTGSYSLTLPKVPASLSFVTLDTSGNLATANSVSGSQIASGSITGTQIAAATVTRSNQVAVGQQISASSGAFSTTSLTLVAVTNLSVTITTSGRPVMVFLQPDGSNFPNPAFILSNAGGMGIQILRGATAIATTELSPSGTLDIPPGSVSVLDIPTAGTYTYSVKILSGSGGTVGIGNTVLVAYEL